MELDLQSLFVLHVHSCTHWQKETPQPPPPFPCIWAHIRDRYWSAKINDISLWPPDAHKLYVKLGLRRHFQKFMLERNGKGVLKGIVKWQRRGGGVWVVSIEPLWLRIQARTFFRHTERANLTMKIAKNPFQRSMQKKCGVCFDGAYTKKIEPSTFAIVPQIIQSARIPLQSSELAPPAPSPAGECCHPFWFQGRGNTLAYRRGGGGSQFGQRDRHSGTLGICADRTYKVGVNL